MKYPKVGSWTELGLCRVTIVHETCKQDQVN